MISISHAQARRLIHNQIDDRRLPDEQWNALHAHLETCPECCAYQARLTADERSLRRVLRQRWDPVEGPLAATAPALAELYCEQLSIRQMGRRMLSGGAAFLLCVLLFIGWSAGIFNNAAAEPVPVDTPVPPTPTPSPTPTRVPSDYRGVIAYEYRPEGTTASEIYLLNTGAEPINLTDDSAHDHDPVWSPDGEWLAFLSDRTGKDEVYVMHISGTRLTQLTSLPEVTWRGPLSWSADGQMLALTGERKIGEGADTWVYFVPLDGSNAYPLSFSKGATLAAFSPLNRMLAFSSREYWDERLVIYNFDSSYETFFQVDQETLSRQPDRVQSKHTVDQFAWSPDGTRLLYRINTIVDVVTSSRRTAGREALRVVTIPEDFHDANPASRTVASDALSGSYPAFSWTGIKNEVAYLVDAADDALSDEATCKTIQFEILSSGKVSHPELNGLCVEDGLDRPNWRVTHKSVLVTGHEPGQEGQRGLYVLRFQGDEVKVEWLSDAQRMIGSPRLRPVNGSLAIAPQPVSAEASLLPTGTPQETPLAPVSSPPGPEAGDLLVVSKLNDRTLIERLAPGSSQRTLINQSIGDNSCPVWSPDRTRIAFLSDRASEHEHVSEVFVMDGSGLNTRQLTQPYFLVRSSSSGPTFPYYGCPVWSADGRWLAVVVYTPEPYLALIALDEKDGAPYYLPPFTGMDISQVEWLPDGRLLAAYTRPGSVRLGTYDPSMIPMIPYGKEPSYTELLNSDEWWYVNDMVVSPDGKSLALAVMRDGLKDRPTYELVTATMESPASGQPGALKLRVSNELPDLPGIFSLNGVSLHWLPDGRLAYTLHYPAGRRVKAEVFAITPEDGSSPNSLASFSDALLASAWSADGRWLTAITEGGRYVLDVSSAPETAPIWIDGEPTGDLDW